jgi:hypothetical protein
MNNRDHTGCLGTTPLIADVNLAGGIIPDQHDGNPGPQIVSVV